MLHHWDESARRLVTFALTRIEGKWKGDDDDGRDDDEEDYFSHKERCGSIMIQQSKGRNLRLPL